ncbi:AAA family ATPase [Saccharopolyspora sp. NPDC000359]|uniref:AAA family ATPase n=1 Tax=Saccharopolyspora sp. NPDC000359 TaxID=3154251 RepID=UPI003331CC3B
MSLQSDLNAVIGEVGALYHERAEETRMITLGMLAGQHTLMLGPPGTAKSALVRELTSRISSAEYWEILLNKFSAPSQIFGPIDVGALAQGQYRQILDGHATTCEIAFVDEIFKCSSAALNSMLAFLNERVYHPESGGAPVACPLISAVCASNELAEDDTVDALYDRLLIRMEVDYLARPESFEALLLSAIDDGQQQAAQTTTVELAALQQAVRGEVPAIALGAAVRSALVDLRADLRHREIVSSDRRWKQAVRLLQASAWLAGREQVSLDDLAVLTHVLWDVPSNRGTVDRLVRGYLAPDDREMADVADQIAQLGRELDRRLDAQDVDGLYDWAFDRHTLLRTAHRSLSTLRATAVEEGRATSWHDAQLEAAERIYRRILTEGLGMDEGAVNAQLASGGAR